MRRMISIYGIALLGVVLLSATDFKVEKSAEIRKSLTFADPSAAKSVEINNIFGSIEVIGTGSGKVELLIKKTIRAESQEKLLKAEEEVTLEIIQEGNDILFYVDGPFRSCDDDSISRWKGQRKRNSKDPGYRVHFDFELRLPRRSDICLKTVTDGDIKVEEIEGRFEVRNVNGGIKMAKIAGSGEAHTVNGEVIISFSRNPEGDCSFKTINGKLEVFFPTGLKADFQLKMFNGEAYSDFPVTYLPT